MKPWLLNILACPIDKHHPLEAYFFTWEGKDDEIVKIASGAGKPEATFKNRYKHLAKQMVDSTISLLSLMVVKDLSMNSVSQDLLEKAKKVANRLKLEKELTEKNLNREFLKDLDILYRYLNLLEVDEGLLVCPKCERWYPIGSAVETIPELLPDDLREKERDLGWLEKWKERIPLEVLEKGKPFNLSNQ